MADDVQVIIGAKIDGLVSAVDQSKSKIESMSASTERVGEGFGKLGELIAAAFSIEAVTAFIEKMAELGLQTERTAAMLGISAQSVVEMGGIAKLTGTSVEGLALQIERMSLNIQRSTQQAFTPQAAALQVLGLRAKDLIGLPADQYFEKLAEAVGKFNPSLNLTNAIMAVGGRGVAQLIPMLLLGADGYRKMKEEVDRAREGLAAAIPGMEETHVKLSLMALSAESLQAVIFSALKPAIDSMVVSTTRIIQEVRDWLLANDDLGKLLTAFNEVLQASAQLVKDFADALGLTERPMGTIKQNIRDVIDLLNLLREGLVVLDAFVTHPFDAAARNVQIMAAQIKTQVGNMIADFDSLFAARERSGSAVSSAPAHGETANKQDAAAINEGARTAVEAQKARYETEIALLQQTLARKKILYDLDAGLWKTTDDQKFASTMQATEAEFEQEKATLQKIRDLWPVHSKEWEVENQKMVAATAKFGTEMVNLNAQSLLSMKSKWDEVFGSLQSSFNGQLRGLLAGTTTFTQAFRTVIGDMVIYFIQAIEKMVFQWIAGQAAQLFATQSTAGAKAASEAAAAESTLPLRVASFASNIAADAALVFAGIFANLAPFLGPAAAAPAAAGQAATLAQLANVPKFETGAWQVPSTMYAQIHKDEMIIPAAPAQAIREGGGGGGGTVILQLLDTAHAQSFVERNAGLLAAAVTNYQSRNRSTRPKW